MKNKDDSWLEQILNVRPQITTDGFSQQLMARIEQNRLMRKKVRNNILCFTYLVSFLLAAFIMPWNWLMTKFNETHNLYSDIILLGIGSQNSVIDLSILFIFLFTVYVLNQETT